MRDSRGRCSRYAEFSASRPSSTAEWRIKRDHAPNPTASTSAAKATARHGEAKKARGELHQVRDFVFGGTDGCASAGARSTGDETSPEVTGPRRERYRRTGRPNPSWSRLPGVEQT